MLARHCLSLAVLFLGLWSGRNLPGQELYFPDADSNWEKVTAAEAGWDASKLSEAIDFAFERKTSSIVILHGGRILAERHRVLTSPARRYRGTLNGRNKQGHVKEDVASVQKSVVSILVGVAIEKGLLNLDDRVDQHLSVGWSKAPREAEAKITVRHLVTMTSGLNPRLQKIAEAGTKWQYNTNAYSRTLLCLEKVSGMDANELSKAWLWERIGMEDSRWEPRLRLGASTDANSAGLVTTARDLARFGLLVQAGGSWDGESVLRHEAYLTEALNSSQDLNPAYGYLWWLNGKSAAIRQGKRVNGQLVEAAPKDLVAAQGALGRKCYVVPSLNLVVTRLGDAPEVRGEEPFGEGFFRRLMLAGPGRQ